MDGGSVLKEKEVHRKRKSRERHDERRYSSSSDDDDTSMEQHKKKKRKEKKTKKKTKKKRKRKKRRHRYSDENDDDDSSTSDSSEEAYRRRRKNSKNRKREKDNREKDQNQEKDQNREKDQEGLLSTREKEEQTMTASSQPSLITVASTRIETSTEQPATRKRAMVPMTQQQYEAQQKQVREVYDEETGRMRLVRGTGEIIERIVSREAHDQINRGATRGDGTSFVRNVFATLGKK